VIIYSARKWARLALAGNPTVLLVLFVPDEEVVPLGRRLAPPQLPELLDPQSEPDASVAADHDPREIVPEYQAFLAQQPGWQAR
jgi:hypothetical protein